MRPILYMTSQFLVQSAVSERQERGGRILTIQFARQLSMQTLKIKSQETIEQQSMQKEWQTTRTSPLHASYKEHITSAEGMFYICVLYYHIKDRFK